MAGGNGVNIIKWPIYKYEQSFGFGQLLESRNASVEVAVWPTFTLKTKLSWLCFNFLLGMKNRLKFMIRSSKLCTARFKSFHALQYFNIFKAFSVRLCLQKNSRKSAAPSPFLLLNLTPRLLPLPTLWRLKNKWLRMLVKIHLLYKFGKIKKVFSKFLKNSRKVQKILEKFQKFSKVLSKVLEVFEFIWKHRFVEKNNYLDL